jgi:hypothetical protein
MAYGASDEEGARSTADAPNVRPIISWLMLVLQLSIAAIFVVSPHGEATADIF